MTGKNSDIPRRRFMKSCAAGAAGAAGFAAAGLPTADVLAASGKKPNIIYIMADDLGYGDLGCYGQKMIQTPNIDRLAAEGMRFTDHYAGSTVCAPSRCCLMTGLHTGHAYIRGNRQVNPQGQEPLPSDTVTVAKLMKKAGYSTALIGKWGLGGPGSTGHPNKQGFDYFYGYLCQGHAHNYYPEFLYRNDKKVPLEGNKVKANERYEGAGFASEKVTYSHDIIAGEALSFVEKNKDNPFFLYLSLTIPHANNEAGKKGMEVPSNEPYRRERWPLQQRNHAAMISRMDSDVGKLMARLKDLGIDDNTLVIFTSDNGPHREGGADPDFFDSNGPLKGIKRDLSEGGIRVPMIARWPGKIKPGEESEHISAFWDFLPTAAEIAGVSVSGKIDGISYLPALTGGEQKEHKFLYWEFHEGQGSKQAARMGKWKAVRNKISAEFQMYDLSKDISELKDVSGIFLEIYETFDDYLKKARTESKFWKLN